MPCPDATEEAVEVIRELWRGEFVNHHGRHYTVEHARIRTRPDTPPPIYVSGFGPKSIEPVGRIGDGYVSTMPDADTVRRFRESGGGKPVRPEQVREAFVCGRNADAHLEMIDRYAEAGFDEVYVADTGPHWQGLFDLYQREVLPRLR
ncbi:LLM class flavin-dependent oxidoreductase [Micromonospora aurantiaca (nom. illeg.)]|uniref:LLM class flavin-dependent oxidoreductase n=1 Tax=Micromonospora aurantiaca (nom. illeg.) TaxID=47850 RepID=UPI0033C61FA2